MSDVTIPKLKRDWVGRHVRLLRQLQNAAGEVFEAGEVMKVYRNYAGLQLSATYECGECGARKHRRITKVCEENVQLMPASFEPATQPTRRELIEHIGELVNRVHHLLEEGKLYGEDGMYAFPDGETFERKGE